MHNISLFGSPESYYRILPKKNNFDNKTKINKKTGSKRQNSREMSRENNNCTNRWDYEKREMRVFLYWKRSGQGHFLPSFFTRGQWNNANFFTVINSIHDLTEQSRAVWLALPMNAEALTLRLRCFMKRRLETLALSLYRWWSSKSVR